MKTAKGMMLVSVIAMTAIACLLVSCLPDPLDVKSVPVAETEMVVSTQIVPGQSLMVLLTKTFGALEGSDNSDPESLLDLIAVNDALITVDGPGGADTLTFLGNGVYVGVSITFEAEQRYHLRIISASMGEAFATTVVKPMVEFDNIEAELYHNGFDDTLAQITYSFSDPSVDNYYMINVQEVEREDFVENLINPRAFTSLLTDEEFNGQPYGERFRVFPRDYKPGDTIAVSLSNISEEYYRFMQMRIDNRFSFVEFVSEPVNYPSNVVGGKGFFNLYLPDVRLFVLE